MIGGSPIPHYCPHAGCSYDSIVGGAKGEGFLQHHLRLMHDGVDPRELEGTPKITVRAAATVESAQSAAPKEIPKVTAETNSPFKVKLNRLGQRVFSPEEMVELIQKWAAEHDGVPPTSIDWQHAQDGYPTAWSVKRAFGGQWSAAVEKAGFPQPRAGGPPGAKRASKKKNSVAARPETDSQKDAPSFVTTAVLSTEGNAPNGEIIFTVTEKDISAPTIVYRENWEDTGVIGFVSASEPEEDDVSLAELAARYERAREAYDTAMDEMIDAERAFLKHYVMRDLIMEGEVKPGHVSCEPS